MSLFTISRQPCAGHVHGRPGCASVHRLHKCGFTLVELSVSMTIAAILVVSSLAVLRQQLDQAQVTSSSDFLLHTVVSLQDFFVGDNGSAPIDNSALANSGAVARQYVGAGSGPNMQITNTWGGRLFVGSLISKSNADWVLQVTGLPMHLCSDIVQGLELSLGAIGLQHTLAGSATAGTDITMPALGSVSLDADRMLRTSLTGVQILKNTPYAPLNPAALSSLCETRQSYFTLFLTSSNKA